MAVYGAFSISTLGMMSQTYALNTIGQNIANVNTGGYKETDTRFQTVLSRTIQEQSDIGGVHPKDVQLISKQGTVTASAEATDVAISGQGFLVLNTKADGSGQTLYGRDGSLEARAVNDITVTGPGGTPLTTKDGYLTDKNGYFVMGWANQAGTYATTAKPTGLRVDQFAFLNKFQATTNAYLGLNIPAGDAIGDSHGYDMSVYDSAGALQSNKLNFTKTATNTWQVTSTTSQTPTAQVDTVTMAGTSGEAGDTYTTTVNGNSVTYTTTGGEASLDAIRDALVAKINADTTLSTTVTAAAGGAGQITLTAKSAGQSFTSSASAANGGATPDNTAASATTTANVPTTQTSTPTTITFNSDGTVNTPKTIALALSFNGGSTANVSLDIGKVTQYFGQFLPLSYTKDGFASANMRDFTFDKNGQLVGSFDDSTHRPVYKLALGVFSNPNALERKNGNVFVETPDSGPVVTTTANADGYATFTPYARELSNVDMGQQFTRMMLTQTAYNASSTVFKTTDEMLTVARDLKR